MPLFFNLLAPFVNEIANILTLSNVINLYPHHPKNNIEIYKKAFIDLISLIGIVSNASHYSRYGYKLGILKGSVLIFLTFFIFLHFLTFWGRRHEALAFKFPIFVH